MADPDRIILIASTIDQAHTVTESSPPSYPSPGGGRVWYIAPNDCYDDPQKRIYKRGAAEVQYPNYVEQTRGWPFISYTIPIMDSADFVLLMNQFQTARAVDGWVWFAMWNGETRSWKLKLGVMERPTVGKFDGVNWHDVTIGFGAIWYQDYTI